MRPSFKRGDRVELMATIINPDGSMGRQVVDDRGIVEEKLDDFSYRVKLDGEDAAIDCVCTDLRLLNAADLLAERLNEHTDD